MNISKIESIWSRELNEYMEERYGIDLDKIIREAENRHNYKEECKESNSQLKKDFIFTVSLMLFFLSPLIILIIMKVASI